MEPDSNLNDLVKKAMQSDPALPVANQKVSHPETNMLDAMRKRGLLDTEDMNPK